MLPQVGAEGQERLQDRRVLVVGAGGLGSPAGLYLAASGVGTVGIMDGDSVDLTNLQRQVIHSTQDLGRPKTMSAAETLDRINPTIRVVSHNERLSATNAERVIDGYDFVIDATDNLNSKFLIADACHFMEKPYSHAGIQEFSGQTMTVLPGQSTCYRCVFDRVPSCEGGCARELGVLGVVPGVLGALQATEAIKFCLGIGDLLTNRFLVYDSLRLSFRSVEVARNTDCPLCGHAPEITEMLKVNASQQEGEER